jgi:hypothetical protein
MPHHKTWSSEVCVAGVGNVRSDEKVAYSRSLPGMPSTIKSRVVEQRSCCSSGAAHLDANTTSARELRRTGFFFLFSSRLETARRVRTQKRGSEASDHHIFSFFPPLALTHHFSRHVDTAASALRGAAADRNGSISPKVHNTYGSARLTPLRLAVTYTCSANVRGPCSRLSRGGAEKQPQDRSSYARRGSPPCQ